MVIGLFAAGCIIGASAARPPDQPASPDNPLRLVLNAPAHADEPPSPAEAVRVFNTVESWVRSWKAPRAGDDLAAFAADGKPLPDVYGACVELRWNGRLIGRGQVLNAASTGADARIIATAASEALDAATPRLPVPNDLNQDAARLALAGEVQISIELAGAPTPIPGQTWGEIDAELWPGLHGVAARIGDDPDAPMNAAFPAEIMSTGRVPQAAIRGVAAAALGEGGAARILSAPNDLHARENLRLLRFRVLHRAQCSPGGPAEFLTRGTRLIGVAQVDLRRFAGSLAGHLIHRVEGGGGGAPGGSAAVGARFGVYRAAIGEYDSPASEGTSRALAALALAEYDRWRRSDRSPPESWLPPATDAARALLATASIAPPPDDAPTSERLSHAALCVLAGQAVFPEITGCGPTIEPGAVPSQPRNPHDALRLLLADDNSLRRAAPAARSLATCALLPRVVSEVTPQAEHRRVLGDAARAIRGLDQPMFVAAMPWFGWSQVRLERYQREVEVIEKSLTRPSRTDIDQVLAARDLPAAIGLRQMRSDVWRHQISLVDAGENRADMVGGIVFTSARQAQGGAGFADGYPTWQCARPLAFIATMLGDARLTEPAEQPQEIANLIQSVRFLRQLQVDESCGWMYPDPAAAIGGIRSAPWDHTITADATSLTLLCIIESLRSLDEIARRSASQPPPTAP